DGDRIVAGWTTFTVRVEPSAEPVPGPAAPAADPCLVARQLRAQPRSLYAILDAARDPKVLELLRASGEKYQSLYEGPEGEELAAFAPYLVELPPASPLLDRLVSEGWGHSWGVYLTSRAEFKEVRRHLRRFLLVKTADGKEAYFRYYDPRVLRTYLPTCTAAEGRAFLGPLGGYLTEAADAHGLRRFTAGPGGLRATDVPSVPARAA